MHRCLQIMEIISAIVDFLPRCPTDMLSGDDSALLSNDSYVGDAIMRRDTLAFALTCRTFLNPGLDALWYAMGSVIPLMKCLPLSSKSLRPESEINTVKPIEVLDTRRFDFYAHRIRVLCVYPHHITPLLYRRLSVSFSDSARPMMPNLLRLTWICVDTRKFLYITLFASPVLQYLMLSSWPWGKGNDDFIFSSVSHLILRSPRLHHAVISDDHSGDTRATAFLVSAFRRLTSVVIRATISADLIAILADMPKLRTLKLDYTRTTPLNTRTPLQPGLHFAALEEFELEMGELDSYTSIFESLSGEHGIKRLEVGFEGCATGSSIARFIQAVSKAVSHDTLSHFQLYTEDRCEQSAQPSHAVDNQMLLPLLEFRKIDYFLLTCCWHAWDNRILEDMARAWPALDTLGLQPHSGEAQDTQLTLGGLYPLAKHCLQLNYIDVVVAPFDGITDRLPKRDWEPVNLRRAEPMTVNVFSRKVDGAATAYLQDMFPRLLVNHISVNDMAVLQYMDENQD